MQWNSIFSTITAIYWKSSYHRSNIDFHKIVPSAKCFVLTLSSNLIKQRSLNTSVNSLRKNIALACKKVQYSNYEKILNMYLRWTLMLWIFQARSLVHFLTGDFLCVTDFRGMGNPMFKNLQNSVQISMYEFILVFHRPKSSAPPKSSVKRWTRDTGWTSHYIKGWFRCILKDVLVKVGKFVWKILQKLHFFHLFT